MVSNNKPIRILQVGMSTNYGGTEAFLMNVYRNIDRNKYQFDFLNVYDEPLACQDEIESLGGHIHNLHLRRRQDGLKKYRQGIKEFYKNNHFDIVQLNAQSLDNIDMLKYAKKYGISKRILYGHNSGFGVKPSKATQVIHRLNKLVVGRHATSFVAVGPTASKWLYPFWLRKKVTILSNSVDTARFIYNGSNGKEIRKLYNLDNKKVYGNLCRLDPQKNHIFLLDIFNEIHKKEKDSINMMQGKLENIKLEKELKDKVTRLGLDNFVIFAGNQKETEKYYSAFDIFLYPTKFEGFGIVLAEAQASGLPILSSDAIPENVICTDLVQLKSLKEKFHKIIIAYFHCLVTIVWIFQINISIFNFFY